MELSKIIASAWADNTVATRKSQWNKYLLFCSDRNLLAIPADSLTVARFLTFLARSSKFSTINNYLSAIIVLHKYHGFNPEFRETFYMKLVLKGLRRILGDETSKAVPLMPEQLIQCYSILDKTDQWWLTCWSAIVLCFRSLLRKSNVLPTTINDRKHVILRKDVTFYNWGVLLNVHSSKTVQYREHKLQVPIFNMPGSPLCAAGFLRNHFKKYPAEMDSPLFLKERKGVVTPLLYHEVLRALKELIRKIGLSDTNVSLHSLRRSGATYLCRIGIPLSDIKTMGDWRSLAVLEYLITPLERKLEIEDITTTILLLQKLCIS